MEETSIWKGACLVAVGSGIYFIMVSKSGLRSVPGTSGRVGRRAVPAGAEEHGGVELLIRAAEVHEELQHLVHDLQHALVGPVDLVEDDDDPVAQLQGLGEHKARLGHGALGGVHEQDDAVDHLQDALHLAAEVGVARGVDYVYLRVAVTHGGVLREYGYAALALEVAGVHDPGLDLLVFAKNARLLEHLVDQRGLAVVDVGDYRNVPQLVQKYHLLFSHKPEFYHCICHFARLIIYFRQRMC